MADVTFTIEMRDDGTPVIRNFRREVDQVTRTVGTAERSFTKWQATIISVNQSFDLLQRGMRAIAGPVGAILDTGTALDRLNNTLKFATGSTDAAAEEFKFLRNASNELGLNFATTAQEYAKLAAASRNTAVEGQVTRDIFLGIAQASTVMGLSADQTGGALLAIQQIISKGTVSAEELRGQLGERLPGAFRIAAESIGVTEQKLGKMLETGSLTAERLLPAFAKGLQEAFGDEVRSAAQSTQAQINRFNNALLELKQTVAGGGILKSFTDTMDELRKVIADPAFQKSLAALASNLGTAITFVVKNKEAFLLLAAGAAIMAGNVKAATLAIGALSGTLIGAAGAGDRLAEIERERLRLNEQLQAADQLRSQGVRTGIASDEIYNQLVKKGNELLTEREALLKKQGAGAAPAGRPSGRPGGAAVDSNAVRAQQQFASSLEEQGNNLKRQLVELTQGKDAAEDWALGQLEAKAAAVGLTGEIVQQLDRVRAYTIQIRAAKDNLAAMRQEILATRDIRDEQQVNITLEDAAAAEKALEDQLSAKRQLFLDANQSIADLERELTIELTDESLRRTLQVTQEYDARILQLDRFRDAASEAFRVGKLTAEEYEAALERIDLLQERAGESAATKLKENTQSGMESLTQFAQSAVGLMSDVVNGSIKTAEDFGRAALTIVIRLIGQLLQLQAIYSLTGGSQGANVLGSIFGGLFGGAAGGGAASAGQFSFTGHRGGMITAAGIRRYHGGGLLPGEVPLIGQTGEMIMSRPAVQSIGAGTLLEANRTGQLPSGEQPVQVSVQINGDIAPREPGMKKEDVVKVVVSSMKDKGAVYGAMIEYGPKKI